MFGFIIGLVAYIAAIAGLVTALGHGGYLYMLNSAARKRAGGEPIARFARSRYGVAAGGVAGGVLALLLAGAGTVVGILAIILGAGTAAYSMKALQTSKERLRIGGGAQ